MQRLRAVQRAGRCRHRRGRADGAAGARLLDPPAKIEATIKAVADHGARFVGANVLFLDGGTRDHFMRFLSGEFPAMATHYEHLYAAKYAPQGTTLTG